mmetsp:Transcript_27250/g.63815  ORF Transcript_27250/g.63815 Transcript_27250/m.63815 type:complete len:218 (-) Transcript_27250:699-1352(-)
MGRGPAEIFNVDVEKLEATTPEGAVRFDFEKLALLFFPVRLEARIAQGLHPRFAVHGVGWLDARKIHHGRGNVYRRNESLKLRPGWNHRGVMNKLRDSNPALVQGPLCVHSVVLLKQKDGVLEYAVVLKGMQDRADGIVQPDLSKVLVVASSTIQNRLAVGRASTVFRHALDPGIARPCEVLVGDGLARKFRESLSDRHGSVGDRRVEVQQEWFVGS